MAQTQHERDPQVAGLADLGTKWRHAADRERKLRAQRDDAIRAAHAAGVGVREIGRLARVDATQVSRVLAR